MSTFFLRLGRLVVRHPWPIVVIWVVGTLAAGRLLPSLGSQVNTSNSAFLPATAPSVKAASLAGPLGIKKGVRQVVVVASRATGPLTSSDRAAITREVALARRLPRVMSVRELETSADGRAAQVVISASASQSNQEAAKQLVAGIQATFGSARPPSGLSLNVAGQVATAAADQAAAKSTSREVQLLSILFIVVLLVIVYRSVLAPVLTLLPAVFALALASSLIGALGAVGLQISQVTQVLLIVLILGAGTDYGLFLVFRVREELGMGQDPNEAIVRALSRVGESITASAGTVILALLTLLAATFGMYHDLGVPLAVGVAVMLLAGLTLLPALLTICRQAAFWPSKIRPGAVRRGLWGRAAARVVARPRLTLITGVVVFGALAFAATGFRAAGYGGTVTAPAGSDAAKGDAALAQYFPQTTASPTNLILQFATPVWTDPKALLQAEKVITASREFNRLLGPLDPNGQPLTPAELSGLHGSLGPAAALPPVPPATVTVQPALYDAYRATAPLVSSNGLTVQFEASLAAGPASSTAALAEIPAVRATLARAARASRARRYGVAGEAAALADVSALSNQDLLHVVPLAVLAIALLLGLVLRSLVAPVYLIASVVLSYLAALGAAVLVFMDLRGADGLTFLLPFLMFIFLLALGEDYNILVMTRIRDETARLPLREAVIRAIGLTGPTVTSAGLVLAGTFTVLAFSGGSGPNGSEIQDIGFGLAIGILMDTFLVRTLLVPSTVAILGRWNWWPSSKGRAQPVVAGPPALDP
ncbi:MAG: MMPL family transporter [Candidatus Dormibacteria bacterium]